MLPTLSLIWKGPPAVSFLVDLGNYWQLSADTAHHPYFLKSTLSFNIRTKEGAKAITRSARKTLAIDETFF